MNLIASAFFIVEADIKKTDVPRQKGLTAALVKLTD